MSTTDSPKRIVAIGSCLSNLIANAMEHMFGYERVYFVAHNRSDNIVRYFVDQACRLPPRDTFDRLIKWKPEFADPGTAIIQNQYPDYFGYQELRHVWREDSSRLLDDLHQSHFDIIIMDNFSDIFGRLMTFKEGQAYADSPLDIPLHMCDNFREIVDVMNIGELLTAEESVANWKKIYSWLRSLQPRANFVFSCFTYSNLYSDKNRRERALEHGQAICRGLSAEDIVMLPCLDLPEEYTKPEDDWSHLQPMIYRALAGYAWTKLFSGWTSS